MQTGPDVTGNGHADRMVDKARHELEHAGETLSRLADRTEEFVRERPAAALLMALGAGILLGRLLRRL